MMFILEKECSTFASTKESDMENEQSDNTEFVQVNTEKDEIEKDTSKGKVLFRCNFFLLK